jgi:hypothetical protein
VDYRAIGLRRMGIGHLFYLGDVTTFFSDEAAHRTLIPKLSPRIVGCGHRWVRGTSNRP